MRILFMGTPDFAVPCLSRLLADGHEIVGVLTQPDKPQAMVSFFVGRRPSARRNSRKQAKNPVIEPHAAPKYAPMKPAQAHAAAAQPAITPRPGSFS